METLILKAAFIDRGGKTVYHAFSMHVEPDPDNPGATRFSEGPMVAVIRLGLDTDYCSVEAVPETPSDSAIPAGGIEGDGTG